MNVWEEDNGRVQDGIERERERERNLGYACYCSCGRV